MNRLSWKKYFMALAKFVAVRSGCNSRPTGAIIVLDKRVIATGYNGNLSGNHSKQCTNLGPGFCLRRSTKKDDKGEKKYSECVSIHAEQNAINQIAKYGGIKLKDAEVYCTLFPCIFCLKNIASVGIKKIYYELIYQSDDEIRDKYWIKKAKEYEIEIEQIILNQTDISMINQVITKTTSIRRL